MCTITQWKKPRRTNRDIVCYKTGCRAEDKFVSGIRSFEYTLNELYEAPLEESFEPEDICPADYVETEYYRGFTEETLRYIASGFHACLTVRGAEQNKGIFADTRVRCVVPKGSLYYKDRTGLIVSNRMIVEKFD